jgi:hypothetical protein
VNSIGLPGLERTLNGPTEGRATQRTKLAALQNGVKLLLFAIVLLLFDIVFAMEQSGLGGAVFLIGVVGLILGVVGLTRRDSQ